MLGPSMVVKLRNPVALRAEAPNRLGRMERQGSSRALPHWQ
jgi:hypothetical protein